MNIKELHQAVASGLRPAIEFAENISELDGYAEKNIRATIVGSQIKNDMIEITFDYSVFEEYNKPFESANFFDEHSQPTMTARDAGYYQIRECYILEAKDDVIDWFSILDEKSIALFNEYTQSKSKLSYVLWLEDQVTKLRA